MNCSIYGVWNASVYIYDTATRVSEPSYIDLVFGFGVEAVRQERQWVFWCTHTVQKLNVAYVFKVYNCMLCEVRNRL